MGTKKEGRRGKKLAAIPDETSSKNFDGLRIRGSRREGWSSKGWALGYGKSNGKVTGKGSIEVKTTKSEDEREGTTIPGGKKK